MKATLNDFRIKFKQAPLLCDNESVVKLTNNLVQHTRTKHINVRHHFIRDHQQKENICIESVGTNDQLADIFTKCWYLLTRTEKIHKRTDTVVAFIRRVLNIISIGKRVSQLRVLT
jgi:hypothetical protein